MLTAKFDNFFLHRFILYAKAFIFLGWIHVRPTWPQSSRALALVVEPIVKGGFGNIKFKGFLGYGFTLGSDEFHRFLLKLGGIATGHALSFLRVKVSSVFRAGPQTLRWPVEPAVMRNANNPTSEYADDLTPVLYIGKLVIALIFILFL